MFAPGGDMAVQPLGHLFGSNVTRVAFKRGTYLREFVVTLAELLSPRLNRALIKQAVQSGDGIPPQDHGAL
jgi:LysR family cys regulon transcriptional activator